MVASSSSATNFHISYSLKYSMKDHIMLAEAPEANIYNNHRMKS